MTGRVEALRRMVAEVAEIQDLERITEDARLYEDLGINSMLGLEVVLLVQEALDITVPEKVLWELKTFGDIIRYVESVNR